MDISSFPVPWDAKAYAEFRLSMNSIPEGVKRDAALKRIDTLDCGNPDTTLASCDPNAETLPVVLDWQNKLEAARVDDPAYARALAKELRSLVCESAADPIYILRGTIRSGRLTETGPEAPALVDFIKSEKCPASTSMTDDDKVKLLQIKQEAAKKFAPPRASNKEK